MHRSLFRAPRFTLAADTGNPMWLSGTEQFMVGLLDKQFASMGKATYIPTPCIGVCRLNEDDICVGCLRSLDEIAIWPDTDLDERIAILDNMSERSKTLPPLY